MKQSTASLLLAAPALLNAHGIFWSPTSRAVLSEQSGYMADATTIISEPMPDVAQDRPYPGGRPFAEPGMSISNVGPCGMETYDELQTNWNHPEHSWGNVVASYNAGDIIDVEWCVSDIADHGGMYSYRICQDDSIVAKFIDPSHTPDQAEMTALEDCFQAGILKCSDVPGQECAVHPDCVNTGWGCEQAAGEWFSCGPKDSGRCMQKGNAGKCATHGDQGSIIRDQVKLPAHTSNHTLLGFRWDCEDTGQLWLHCADIELK
mmetsp:Transcript_7717/g.13019  ORF Transcript_7717/g.13019 Transcript_7717/m.13019 type:complete len:262 (+) Transcript_7717:27-812(+)|eukprot:CAMPEP_0114462262 /NCGR_PEP_ID=MMETSP0104-20121206/6737_1 /TAXON_ID=37642 ORGANISM="Paraphysomonas imperforata, Strain PA2" /NCGR_SAMPLE_ID=MMETSP0104 /ASSEMBLY_ACC=CAM_ASM_000202 /LENGTH=261 /DNA_ID=CAMNT_0001635133 /DNA_START=26 /DNA_END=811 /DNA_ORIENTATION=-